MFMVTFPAFQEALFALLRLMALGSVPNYSAMGWRGFQLM
jgi:hypothetical protein